MKRIFYVTLSLALVAGMLAAEEPKKPELTAEQKLSIRSAQVKVYEAQDQKRQAEQILDKQIADAQNALNQTVSSVYAVLKVKDTDYVLCSNPSPNPPACKDAPAGDLTLQPAVPVTGKPR